MKKTVIGLFIVFVSSSLYADHSWGPYHWASTSSPRTVTVVNSVKGDWGSYVTQAISDWSLSEDVTLIEESGSTRGKTRRQCSAPSGQVRICNARYGTNAGWLGIASISLNTDDHIISGYTKLNDSFFSMEYYDTFAWRQSVTCQELGHNIGLSHQDETFDNESLYSCMDYQDPPYEYPNDHDYEQLGTIYDHLDDDDTTSNATAPESGMVVDNRREARKWGQSQGRSGNRELFVRHNGDGTKQVTHVYWADGHNFEDSQHH